MRSMTGYSKELYENDDFRVKIEIKSVNNKNLNLKIKLPYILNFLENRIKTEVASRVSRGSLDLRIDFEDKRELGDLFEYNGNLASSYMKVLEKMEDDFNEKFSNKLDILIKQPNVVRKNELEIDETEYSEVVKATLHKALDSFLEMKEEEGFRLRMYFRERLQVIEGKVTQIIENKEKVVDDYREKLLERLERVRRDIEFKEDDILKEILLFTDKSDISEETSRLESHIEQFKIELEKNEPSIGKKLDFILQEMFRELNTTGVKSNLYDISKLVVECKNEVEKIREQALNIE
ncbi:YicC/YloC family endoribonuclease [uncultured Ilyobacter sp.]|uniref:YicC/YloC family endoribonuclease n=1 Tax=uncultured Ilyobacter sp. TaxID=544433 RepID=UPI0029C61301|nr:YicC/YloC family endoribonuclease [uncultured Ilyobacter sp.]